MSSTYKQVSTQLEKTGIGHVLYLKYGIKTLESE